MGTHWKGTTRVVSSWQSMLWKSWRGLWMASSDSWCQLMIPVWLHPRQKHYRCNLCCQAAAREVSCCQQETLRGFCRPGEGNGSSSSEGHLVGAEKTWCGGVDCATDAGDVCKCLAHVDEGYSEEFEVKVGVHQGSVLSLLLFIIVLEALSREFSSGVPWEDLYADDLVIIAESLEECVRRLLTWKEAMEKKGLKSKCRKDKDHDRRYRTGPPTEFRWVSMWRLSHWSGQQQHLLQWLQALGAQEMHGLKRLKKDPGYRCTRCQGTARPLHGRPQKEVQVGPDKLRW